MIQNCGYPCWGQPISVIQGIAVDLSGNAYVAGYTNTYDLPTTDGAYMPSQNSSRQPANWVRQRVRRFWIAALFHLFRIDQRISHFGGWHRRGQQRIGVHNWHRIQ